MSLLHRILNIWKRFLIKLPIFLLSKIERNKQVSDLEQWFEWGDGWWANLTFCAKCGNYYMMEIRNKEKDIFIIHRCPTCVLLHEAGIKDQTVTWEKGVRTES